MYIPIYQHISAHGDHFTHTPFHFLQVRSLKVETVWVHIGSIRLQDYVVGGPRRCYLELENKTLQNTFFET